MWVLEFYETENGKLPVQDFLDGLDTKMRAKALKELMLLKEFGTQLREPYSKPMGNGVFELRIKLASDNCRMFYFFVVGNRIILTNGFIKKSAKTPIIELTKAQKYKSDFERRMMIHE